MTRFEVPLHIPSGHSKPHRRLYDLYVGDGHFGFFFQVHPHSFFTEVKKKNRKRIFQVVRRSTGRVLFDTHLPGGLVFESQYLQLATRLPEGVGLYGLGENYQTSYRHDLHTWKTWVGYARWAGRLLCFFSFVGNRKVFFF